MDTFPTELQTFAKQAESHLGQSPQARMGLRTGLPLLDYRIRGLHNSKLYVVGARPGVGKTSFATTIAANVMLQRDFPVCFVSTELEEWEIMLQMAEAYSQGVPVYPNGRTSTPDEIERLKASLGELAQQERYGLLNVIHQKRITVPEVAGWVDLVKPEDDRPFLLIVDQASRIKRDDANGRRSYAIATEDMLNDMEALAKDKQCIVLLLTQLGRPAEFQKIPMLANLKHSGAFEEYAHCVLLLEQLEGCGQKKPGSSYIHHDARVHVAKNRHGMLGPIDFNFHGESHHWTEKTERQESR